MPSIDPTVVWVRAGYASCVTSLRASAISEVFLG
jgi:hypothetical protein